MLTRYSFVTSIDTLKSQFNVIIPNQFRLSYNIAPTHHAYVITNENPKKLQYITWGLIPHWAKEGKNEGKLINARMEGITSAPSFRIPIRERRCLILADSFYVWQKWKQQLVPHRVALSDGMLMAIAGLWDIWDNGGYPIKSFAMITRSANKELKGFYHRMPVLLLTKDVQQQWIMDNDLNQCTAILDQQHNDLLDIYKITDRINSPTYKGRDLHDEEIEPPTNFTLT